MFILATHYFGSSSGLGSLGLSASGFLIQLITFIIAILVLRKWAFKPIMKVMNERRQAIEKGVTLGEQMEKEKAALEEKVSQTLHETRRQADKIISDARDSAKQMVREAEDQARVKAAAIAKDAEAKGDEMVQRAWRKMEGQFASLVAGATEAVVGEKVDAKKDASIIDKAIKEQIKA